MSTRHVSAAELRKLMPGSRDSHESLQDAVIAYLRLVARLPVTPIYTGAIATFVAGKVHARPNPEQAGIADLIVALPPYGRLWLLELKTGGACRRPLQVRKAREYEAAGALCTVARSVDDVRQVVDANATQHNLRRKA